MNEIYNRPSRLAILLNCAPSKTRAFIFCVPRPQYIPVPCTIPLSIILLFDQQLHSISAGGRDKGHRTNFQENSIPVYPLQTIPPCGAMTSIDVTDVWPKVHSRGWYPDISEAQPYSEKVNRYGATFETKDSRAQRQVGCPVGNSRSLPPPLPLLSSLVSRRQKKK